MYEELLLLEVLLRSHEIFDSRSWMLFRVPFHFVASTDLIDRTPFALHTMDVPAVLPAKESNFRYRYSSPDRKCSAPFRKEERQRGRPFQFSSFSQCVASLRLYSACLKGLRGRRKAPITPVRRRSPPPSRPSGLPMKGQRAKCPSNLRPATLPQSLRILHLATLVSPHRRLPLSSFHGPLWFHTFQEERRR